jgi:hypothetical protein
MLSGFSNELITSLYIYLHLITSLKPQNMVIFSLPP